MKSLRSKLIIILLLTSLIPLAVATIYSYQISNKAISDKVNSSQKASLKTISKSIDSEILRITTEIDIATMSREFQHAANTLVNSKTEGAEWVALRAMDSLMLGIFGRTYSISGLYLTLKNGKSYAVQDNRQIDLKTLSTQKWFQNEDNNIGTLVQCGILPDKYNQSAVIFGKIVRDVTDAGNLALIGSVHFVVSPQLFNGISSQTEIGTTMLFDRQDQLLASEGNFSPVGVLELLDDARLKHENAKNGSTFISIEGVPAVMLYNTSDMYGYSIVRIIPTSLYTNEISQITRITLIFAAICVAAVIFIAILVSNYVSKPIEKLNQAMKYTEKGNFDVFLPSKNKDEIGQVTRRFNKMVRRLQSFFDQTIKDEKMKKELEISALQYQINPHFLYNVLASVRSLALIENAQDTAQMLNATAKLLKSTIGYAGSLISLSQEIGNIKRLLYIQNVCHSGMVSFTISVEEGISSCQIPNLILQPVVENAVFYGSNPETGRVTIKIEAIRKGEALLLQVSDDGAGISVEKQKSIFSDNKVRNENLTHIGLNNTNERIKLNFGEPYGITLNSSEIGTQVRLLLPFLELKNNEEQLLNL
ncbi:MAG: histidine kinase [Oscillospiraceae bacterium]